MLLKANKYRKDKKADCRQNELGSRIFMGRVFGDYAKCLHFYPGFSYGRIIAGKEASRTAETRSVEAVFDEPPAAPAMERAACYGTTDLQIIAFELLR